MTIVGDMKMKTEDDDHKEAITKGVAKGRRRVPSRQMEIAIVINEDDSR